MVFAFIEQHFAPWTVSVDDVNLHPGRVAFMSARNFIWRSAPSVSCRAQGWAPADKPPFESTDEHLESGLDGLVEFFLQRVLGGVLQAIFYWPGWMLLRLVTLGRYPPKQAVEHNRFAVALFAIVCCALLAALLSIK